MMDKWSKIKLAATLRGSRPGVQSASLIMTSLLIYDVIIWVQDGNCKKMARENFSIGAFYNITKNHYNPIKTVGQDSFLSPKPIKIPVF